MLTMNGLLNRLLGLLEMPFSERHIIITLVLQGEKTYVRVDLEENVKATSILCLLGFGIGFGSVLLYKIYARFVSRCPQLTQTAASQTTYSRKRQHSNSNSRKVKCNSSSDSDEEDSDDDETNNRNNSSGVTIIDKTMGNTGSFCDEPVYYNACRNGVSFANYPENDWAKSANLLHQGAPPIDIPASPMQRHLHQRKLSRQKCQNDSNSVLPQNSSSVCFAVDADDVNIQYANTAARDRSISDVNDRLLAAPDDFAVDKEDGSPGGRSNDSVKITNFDEVSLFERTVLRQRKSSPDKSRSQRNSVEFESLCQKRDKTTFPAHCVSDGDLLPDDQGNLRDPVDYAPPWLGGGVDISEMSSPDFDLPSAARGRPRLPSGNASDVGDIFNASFRRLNFRRETHSVDTGLSNSPDSDIFADSNSIRTVQQLDKLETDLDALKSDMNVIFARIHQLSKGSEPSDSESSEFDLEAYRNREVSRAMTVLQKYRRSSFDAASVKSFDSSSDSCASSPGENRRASWQEKRRASSPGDLKRFYAGKSPRSSITPDRLVLEEEERYDADILHLGVKSDSDKSDLSLPLVKSISLDDAVLIHGAQYVPRLTELYVTDGVAMATADDLTSSVGDVSIQSSTTTPESDMSSSLCSPMGTMNYLPAVPEDSVIINCDDNGNSGDSSSSSGIDNYSADKIGSTCDVYSYAEALQTNITNTDVDTVRQRAFTEDSYFVEKKPVARKNRILSSLKIYTKPGFHAITEHSHCRVIRHIHSDNYSAIRAALFQVLRNNIRITDKLGPVDGIIQKLRTLVNSSHPYLKQWNFGGKAISNASTVETLDLMTQCLHSLYNQLNSLSPMTTASDRESSIVTLLNSNSQTDRMLMEAVKLLMMLTVIQLYDDMKQDKEVPVFAWLMFARETSQNPRMFFTRHLNKIGLSSGLEQVEMFLLAYTLGSAIEVIRPHEFGKQDYVTFYQSGFTASSLPVITLVTEDDLNYNVVLP